SAQNCSVEYPPGRSLTVPNVDSGNRIPIDEGSARQSSESRCRNGDDKPNLPPRSSGGTQESADGGDEDEALAWRHEVGQYRSDERATKTPGSQKDKSPHLRPLLSATYRSRPKA